MTPGFAGRSCGAARFRLCRATEAPGAWSLRSHAAGARRLRRRCGPAGRGRFAPLDSRRWLFWGVAPRPVCGRPVEGPVSISVRASRTTRLRMSPIRIQFVAAPCRGRCDARPACWCPSRSESMLAVFGPKLRRLSPGWRLRMFGDAFGPGSPLQSPLADAPGNFRCDPYRLRSLALPARSACP